MNATSAPVAGDVDEFALGKLTKVASRLVDVPRVGESPVAFECKMSQINQLQDANGAKVPTWLVLGEVVAVHILRELIVDGVYQMAKARPILRAGGAGDYVEVQPEAVFEMFRPT